MGALNLQVVINPGSGFCFGVHHAIMRAEEWLDKGTMVYCVGQIVHNEDEVARLEAKGLRTITLDDLDHLHDQLVLFRAHGEPPSTYKKVKENGNTLIDASCKVVLRLQLRIKEACERGEHVFIFGKKNHPETIALLAQTNGRGVLLEHADIPDLIPLPKKLTLFAQTTASPTALRELASNIRARGIDLTLHDTVCRQVTNREEQLAVFAREVDVNVFISGKHSSNGMVLFNICLAANPSSYRISEVAELDKSWFRPGQKVGVSGATSTPLWLMERIRQTLESW